VNTGRGQTIRALYDNVAGLKVGSEVSVAGVRVGRVTKIALSDDGGALVSLRLDQAMEVPDDTIASIGMSGIMGEKFVSLQIGGSDILLDGKNDILYDTQPSVDLMGMISKMAFGSIESGH